MHGRVSGLFGWKWAFPGDIVGVGEHVHHDAEETNGEEFVDLALGEAFVPELIFKIPCLVFNAFRID